MTLLKPATSPSMLGAVISEITEQSDYEWALKNFPRTVGKFIRALPATSVLEVGGGRSPMFSEKDIASFGCFYTVNDIAQTELNRAPDYVSKACFDIGTSNSQDLAPFAGKFDFIFSKFVFEHVKDAEQAYRNIRTLLRPGGICLNYHPVLFAIPFVINWLVPDRFSRALLLAFFPHRNDEGKPKFPSFYSLCNLSESARRKIQSCGFASVHRQAFYNHAYFRKLPLLREADKALANYGARNGITSLASYSYTIAMR